MSQREDGFFLEEDGFFSSCNQQIDDLNRTIENLKTDNKNNSGLCSLRMVLQNLKYILNHRLSGKMIMSKICE